MHYFKYLNPYNWSIMSVVDYCKNKNKKGNNNLSNEENNGLSLEQRKKEIEKKKKKIGKF